VPYKINRKVLGIFKPEIGGKIRYEKRKLQGIWKAHDLGLEEYSPIF
jgi:hypothetical protein